MSTQSKNTRTNKVTTQTIVEMKARGEKISMLTAYDYTMAGIIDQAGTDVILVGDSAGNVMAGYETTVPMTLDHLIYHSGSFVRAVERGLIIADLPFINYQVTASDELTKAGRTRNEAGGPLRKGWGWGRE